MLRYKLLGQSGLRVSEICLGTMTFGDDFGWGASKEVCRSMFEHFADLGGNFIDTAPGYTSGSSEKILGELIASERARYVVGTKYTTSMARPNAPRGKDPNAGGNHRKNLVESLEGSLRRLNTDYIDVYWVHMWDQVTPVDEVMRALDDVVRAGKVLHVGISNTPAWWIARANTIAEFRGWSRFIAMEIEYSLAERTSEQELLPLSRAMDIGVVAWGPLGGGVLTGKYNADVTQDGPRRLDAMKGAVDKLGKSRLRAAEAVRDVAAEAGVSPARVALAWILAKRGVIPIIGARTMEQYLDNMQALECKLTEEQLAKLDQATRPHIGYPQGFLQQSVGRSIFNGTIDRLDTHRNEGGILDV
jgi:aryl-alcohol dehydrogenase-like predicted oxidoreductase